MAVVQRPEELTTTTPANWVPGPPQGSWTYDVYAALPDDGKRYEIAQGVLIGNAYASLGIFTREQQLQSHIVPEMTASAARFF